MAVDDAGNPDTTANPSLSLIWRTRLFNAWLYVLDLVAVLVIYLCTEVIIWALSMLLSLAHLQFFASILGMLIVFCASLVGRYMSQKVDGFYLGHLRSKVDFINANLGLGFPIPIVMLDDDHALKGVAVARIIANFLVTNVISWISIFFISVGFISAVGSLFPWIARIRQSRNTSPDATGPILAPSAPLTPGSGSLAVDKESQPATPVTPSEIVVTMSSDQISAEEAQAPVNLPVPQRLGSGSSFFAVPLAAFCFVAIGLPIAIATGERRILDLFAIWCAWIMSARGQKFLKTSSHVHLPPRVKNVVATLMNPVLITTLILIGYTRIITRIRDVDLITVLEKFSGGTPIYALLTAKVTGETPSNNPTGWFGAGDAALSILECGLVVWGFKLYECRQQLFSKAGLCTVIIATVSAVGNVFLCTLSGRAMGMATPEALAFAARSVTLALSKPAMNIVGGNLAANAALVVSNGILGQLMYPFLLHRLGVSTGAPAPAPAPAPAQQQTPLTQAQVGEQGIEMSDLNQGPEQTGNATPSPRTLQKTLEDLLGDSPATIAGGITVGINGAAMGVAYLYATKSRAAPYATLSMTIFGIMTVVLITVEPFKGLLTAIANM